MQSTRAAKAVYRLSGWVSRIKSYRQTYRLANEEEWLAAEGDMAMMFQPAGRAWGSIKLTWKLLDLAVRWDKVHFDHWALQHTGKCASHECPDCGGVICLLEDDE